MEEFFQYFVRATLSIDCRANMGLKVISSKTLYNADCGVSAFVIYAVLILINGV